jgi:hypothetical protein
MKKIVMIWTMLLLSLLCFSQRNAPEILTNRDILYMLKSGISPTTVMTKITGSTCSFSIGTDSLIYLKANKVPDNVIDMMIDRQKQMDLQYPELKNNVGIHPVNQKDSNFQGSGIYYYEESTKKYYKLDPTGAAGSSSSDNRQNLLLSFGNNTTRTSLGGKQANREITSNQPVFFFYFDYVVSSLNNTTHQSDVNYMDRILGGSGYGTENAMAASPNDFKLIRLKTTKYDRWYVSKKSGSGSVERGVDPKQIELFKYDRVRDNLFRVYFEKGLQSGEYCFVYAGSGAVEGSGNAGDVSQVKVFDFGIVGK